MYYPLLPSCVFNIVAIDDLPKWIWDNENAGQDCREVCENKHFLCKEDAAWPGTKEEMENIARENNITCDIFCQRPDFSEAPVIIPKGEKNECDGIADGQQCIYNKPKSEDNRETWRCTRKFDQRIRICPCIGTILPTVPIGLMTKIKPSVTMTTAAEEVSVVTTLLDGSSPATTTTATTKAAPGRKNKGFVVDMGLGDVDLVSLVVIATGATAGLFFVTIVVAACVCTCIRRRANTERNSRRRERSSRSSSRRSRSSRRSSSRRSSRRSSSRRNNSRRSPSSSSGPTSSSSSRSRSRGHDRDRHGRLKRDRQSSARTLQLHTVVHMAENEYDDSGFMSPRAGPYNVDSELYGMNEELTLTEMLETYGNRNY